MGLCYSRTANTRVSVHLERPGLRVTLAILRAFLSKTRTPSPLAGGGAEDAASRLASSVVLSVDLRGRFCIIEVMFDSDSFCVPFAGGSSCPFLQRLGVS